MYSVSHLCQRFNVARTTLLYYERSGLLHPKRQSNGYRIYSDKDIARLEQILSLRALDIPIADINHILSTADQGRQRVILQQQFERLGTEIQRLQSQQRTIVKYLEQPPEQDDNMISKERWTEVMRAAGLTDQDMQNWHKQFEKLEPQAHQEFLQSLGIDPEEVDRIRQWSQQ